MSSRNLITRDYTTRVTAISALAPSAIQNTNNSSLTFELNSNSVGSTYIEELALRFTINNTSASVGGTQLVPAPIFIQRARLYCGGTMIEELDGEQIWMDMLAYEDENKLIGYSNVNGFSTTDFLSNNEFIASQSKTFLTPIRTMLSGSHVPMCHENVQWRLEFEFRGGASLID